MPLYSTQWYLHGTDRVIARHNYSKYPLILDLYPSLSMVSRLHDTEKYCTIDVSSQKIDSMLMHASALVEGSFVPTRRLISS